MCHKKIVLLVVEYIHLLKRDFKLESALVWKRYYWELSQSDYRVLPPSIFHSSDVMVNCTDIYSRNSCHMFIFFIKKSNMCWQQKVLVIVKINHILSVSLWGIWSRSAWEAGLFIPNTTSVVLFSFARMFFLLYLLRSYSPLLLLRRLSSGAEQHGSGWSLRSGRHSGKSGRRSRWCRKAIQ